MSGEVLLLYDGECPLCSAYGCAVQRHGAAGIELVDARRGGEWLVEATRRGLDLDRGIVVVADGRYYYGAQAGHLLSRRLAPRTAFGLLNRTLFGSPRRARFFYPPLRALRALWLRLLGRSPIRNLPP